jgi:uncharacterized protein YndB with AHSA1/START domain
LIALVAGVLALAASKPDTFTIQRHARINAPPDKIFDQIVDFHNWRAWSPWERLDPDMTRTYAGAPKGQGAVYAWQGKGKAGSGQMTILDAQPALLVRIELAFTKPFKAVNTVVFQFVPAGRATDVTWTMTGTNVLVGKIMGLAVDMDTLVGSDFETGLASLKAVAES